MAAAIEHDKMTNDPTSVVVCAPNERTESAPVKTYEVICISTYPADLAAMDAMVADLKARGIRKANRSWLIRLALSRLDINTITQEDRP